MSKVKQFLRKFCLKEEGSVSIEVAVATPILIMMALSCVEITNFVLFQQKLDRAVATVGDLTSQARGITAEDIVNIHDAAEYILQPYLLEGDAGVIVSSISPDGDEVEHLNWQWSSTDQSSKFGMAGNSASMPDGFSVRSGESIIVSEIYLAYEPIILSTVFQTDPYYSFTIFRPRFDALTELD